MSDFEEKLRALLESKLLPELSDFTPNPKASLSVLLEHVYKKVLVPAHYILTDQEQFSSSSLEFDEEGFGDSMADGMEDRPMAVLRINRQGEPLFEYWLSFDGDSNSAEARLWRKVDILYVAPKFEDLPASFDDIRGTTSLSEDAINSLNEYESFATLDLNEIVALVQEDFYFVCDTLL